MSYLSIDYLFNLCYNRYYLREVVKSMGKILNLSGILDGIYLVYDGYNNYYNYYGYYMYTDNTVKLKSIGRTNYFCLLRKTTRDIVSNVYNLGNIKLYELNGTNVFTMDFNSIYMLVVGNEYYIIDSELTDKEKTQLDKVLKAKVKDIGLIETIYKTLGV